MFNSRYVQRNDIINWLIVTEREVEWNSWITCSKYYIANGINYLLPKENVDVYIFIA